MNQKNIFKMLMGFFLMFWCFDIGYFGSTVGAYDLPATGITKCYDAEKEIPCPNPGESFYGQDGNYKKGAPLSYKDNGNGTVTDINTGMIWQQSDDGKKHTWSDACEYCKKLKLAGHSDWRIPTVDQLGSIVDFSRLDPAINTIYFKGQSGWFWSGSYNHDDSKGASVVSFFNGGLGYYGRTGLLAVRCVRGGGSFVSSFVDNHDGTVTQNIPNKAGLMWQQDPNSKTSNWQDACEYCNKLNLGGKKDWRLPNIRELETIVDRKGNNPLIDSSFFCESGYYWSSSTLADMPNTAWLVSFGAGLPYSLSKGTTNFVRCVRDRP
ncbi:MAG: DUF1566 domain-containing protein [Deltaproteobacteria bacterium]|nr:DUF1566 domain-containing protein [Deltaproteobacteria bacterium]